MRIKTKFFFLLSCLLSIPLIGQDLTYAKSIVRTLASTEFKGRGYVEHGEKLAAEYIRSEFTKIGLKPVGKSYFQKFNTSINSFPKRMELSINGKRLIPGKDFLIDASSPSVSGIFEVVRVQVSDILDPDKLRAKLQISVGKFIVVEAVERKLFVSHELAQIDNLISYLKFNPTNTAAGSIFMTTSKLTWGASTSQYAKPSFTVRSEEVYPDFETVRVVVDAKYMDEYSTQNVVGWIEGERSDSMMVFVAHYDHLGMMGQKVIFPGANDNASGVAMLLNLARFYKNNTPKFNCAFIAFGGEEIGLLGSKYFVENPLIDLSRVKFLLNFDISGTGDDGIQVVNGSVYREQFDLMAEINEEQRFLSQVKIRGEACNSDHCLFHMKKVPCFFIYTLGGNQAYHDIYDRFETLPLTKFEDYFKLIVEFVERM